MSAYVDHDEPMGPMEDMVVPEYAPEATIQDRFDAFHQANPWVLQALEALAADWFAHGNEKVGLKALVEIVRWQYGRSGRGSSWRLNNNWTSRYARLMVERHPEWADKIETRSLRAA